MKILSRLTLAIGLMAPVAGRSQDGKLVDTGFASPPAAKRKANTAKVQYGTASYYAAKFNGRKTSSGELYDSKKFTAAHNGLPLGTWIKVTNLRNGRTVVVKVNDRLHHRNTRLVDLSGAAAAKLGYLSRGLTKVKVEVLGKKKPEADSGEMTN
ncbi:septal ring lytic transglycosylase RlpA family protein [Flavihumibacter rivuli]|uniref:septal ring lytic transglycosylase RlpA family protein n=1 Tax=Flavihumibacter rivuli TaxID=2838156 RepID=UPI001BDEE8C0|nr:septal ring lytic transglycosylase RlpA family protein [Flavihumibacter rivuli]ULQ57039.1 septal ring lytic transglycosylase RlpA family protein [Flavihumibacter rivuli]